MGTEHVFKSWRTTLLGLSALLPAIATSVHFDGAGRLLMTQRDWFGIASASAIAVVGALMKDCSGGCDAPQGKQ